MGKIRPGIEGYRCQRGELHCKQMDSFSYSNIVSPLYPFIFAANFIRCWPAAPQYPTAAAVESWSRGSWLQLTFRQRILRSVLVHCPVHRRDCLFLGTGVLCEETFWDKGWTWKNLNCRNFQSSDVICIYDREIWRIASFFFSTFFYFYFEGNRILLFGLCWRYSLSVRI